jgi:hypothetical protein
MSHNNPSSTRRPANIHRIGTSANRPGKCRNTNRLTGSTHCTSSTPSSTGPSLPHSSSSAVTSSKSSSGSPARPDNSSTCDFDASGRTPERSASNNGPAGEFQPIRSAFSAAHRNPIADAWSTTAENTLDLPIPGSPSTSRTPPCPNCWVRRSMVTARPMTSARPRRITFDTTTPHPLPSPRRQFPHAGGASDPEGPTPSREGERNGEEPARTGGSMNRPTVDPQLLNRP